MNKYAHLSGPQAELDFHNQGTLTPNQIEQQLNSFLEESQQKGLKKLLIITGKGLHSENGAVVRPIIQNLLSNHPLVKTALTARRDRGGEGAIEVSLNI